MENVGFPYPILLLLSIHRIELVYNRCFVEINGPKSTHHDDGYGRKTEEKSVVDVVVKTFNRRINLNEPFCVHSLRTKFYHQLHYK